MLIVPSFVIVGLCSTMLQLYTGLGLYAVSTAFVVPCLTTLVTGYGETHQKVTKSFMSLVKDRISFPELNLERF